MTQFKRGDILVVNDRHAHILPGVGLVLHTEPAINGSDYWTHVVFSYRHGDVTKRWTREEWLYNAVRIPAPESGQ